jgi:hypothetical protein
MQETHRDRPGQFIRNADCRASAEEFGGETFNQIIQLDRESFGARSEAVPADETQDQPGELE